MLIQISFHDKCALRAGLCALRAAGCCTVVYIMFIAILLCSLGLWRQGKAVQHFSQFIINLCWTSMLIQISFHDKCALRAGLCALRAAGCCTVVYIMFIAILLCSLGLWRQGKAVQYATAVGGNATHKRWQSDDIHFMASLRSCAVLHIVPETAKMFKICSTITM